MVVAASLVAARGRTAREGSLTACPSTLFELQPSEKVFKDAFDSTQPGFFGVLPGWSLAESIDHERPTTPL